jgi:hypothetical protein
VICKLNVKLDFLSLQIGSNVEESDTECSQDVSFQLKAMQSKLEELEAMEIEIGKEIDSLKQMAGIVALTSLNKSQEESEEDGSPE